MRTSHGFEDLFDDRPICGVVLTGSSVIHLFVILDAEVKAGVNSA